MNTNILALKVGTFEMGLKKQNGDVSVHDSIIFIKFEKSIEVIFLNEAVGWHLQEK
jgi:hypothetical protein